MGVFSRRPIETHRLGIKSDDNVTLYVVNMFLLMDGASGGNVGSIVDNKYKQNTTNSDQILFVSAPFFKSKVNTVSPPATTPQVTVLYEEWLLWVMKSSRFYMANCSSITVGFGLCEKKKEG